MKAEQIFQNIEKTHQAPQCKKCRLRFSRLDQGTMICESCKDNKGKTLDKWLKK